MTSAAPTADEVRPTRSEAIAAAGTWFAVALDDLDALTPRQVAERVAASHRTVDPDAVEDKVRRLRGLPALDRTAAPSAEPGAEVAARRQRAPRRHATTTTASAPATPTPPAAGATTTARTGAPGATTATTTTSRTATRASEARPVAASTDPMARVAGMSREEALALAAAIRAEYE